MALTKVSTDGVKDDAITSGKIPAQAIGTSEIADNTITQNDLADNSVGASQLQTGGVNTANIADDAVTIAKLADDAVGTTQIADQAVTLAKLPHGTSSNDGKFLRANNGADPTFETVSGTTINNNADNRLITGSGTANTVNAETSGTFSSGQLKILTDGAAGSGIRLVGKSGNNGSEVDFVNNADNSVLGYIEFSDLGARFWNQTNTDITIRTNNTERLRVLAGGGLTFNGDTATANALDDYEKGNWTPTLTRASGTIGGTIHTAMGMYIKVGKMVYITFHVYGTGVAGGSSYYQLAGLPFGVDSSNQGSWSISPHMTRSYFDSEKAAGDNALSIKFLGSGNTYGYSYNADTDNWYTQDTSVIVLKGQMTYITAS